MLRNSNYPDGYLNSARELSEVKDYYEDYVHSLQDEIADKNKQLRDLQQSLNEALSENQKLRMMSMTRESQLNEFRNSALQSDRVLRRLDEAETERNSLENENLRLRNDLAKYEHELKVQRDENIKLLTDLDLRSARVVDLERHHDELVYEGEKFKSSSTDAYRYKWRSILVSLELERLSNVFAEQMIELDEWSAKYREMKSQQAGDLHELDNLKEKIRFSDDIQRENQILKNKLDIMQDENDRLTKRVNYDEELNIRQNIVPHHQRLIYNLMLLERLAAADHCLAKCN